MIRGILFDLGWTLMKPETGDWMLTRKFREYCPQELQNTISPETWHQALYAASVPLAEAHNAGRLLTREAEEDAFADFYYDLVNGAGLQMSWDAARVISHDRTYVYDDKYILLDGLEEVLEHLQAQGLRLGILSDTWPSMPAILDHFELTPYFDSITYSYEVGTFKPDPRMFEDALDKIGLPGKEVVFLDDLVKNLEGAKQFGIKGILARMNEKIPDDPGYPSITDLRQLPEILLHIQSR
ncbi:MAG: HAD-IA family hydrolase [Solobacterium sp.]|nr:HAD-IA family hydrolase [Solobacterium sp.]